MNELTKLQVLMALFQPDSAHKRARTTSPEARIRRKKKRRAVRLARRRNRKQ